ncbi:hypothetical protein RYR54_000386 [Aeromonas sobria]|nr:hypothetical protein [Aeromonas sobria]
MQIDALCLAFESEGKAYFVNTKKDDWGLILQMVRGLSETGKLEVTLAPENVKFTTLADAIKESV